ASIASLDPGTSPYIAESLRRPMLGPRLITVALGSIASIPFIPTAENASAEYADPAHARLTSFLRMAVRLPERSHAAHGAVSWTRGAEGMVRRRVWQSRTGDAQGRIGCSASAHRDCAAAE